MSEMTRRSFLAAGGKLAAMMGLGAAAGPALANTLANMSNGQVPVLWLQAQSCSGCSVSLLNADEPNVAGFITGYISLKFHSNVSAATGKVAMDVINRTINSGEHIVVVEGSVPAGMEEACIVGHEKITDQIRRAAKHAKAVVAVGTCAAHGGIPAAENNPTGAVDVETFLKANHINKPVVKLPGCPAHPDWIVGSVVHLLEFGVPDLDEYGRPKMFYGQLVHDQCPRFADYEREVFAKHFSDEGCLFKLGCLGPLTHADCTVRQWNKGANSCIKAGAPCIGCASEQFALKQDLPLYRVSEDEPLQIKH